MTDDDRITRLLREQAEARVGDHRPSGPFVAPPRTDSERRGRRRPPWLLPLLAAACVALLGGSVATAELLSSSSNRPVEQPTRPMIASSPAPSSPYVAPSVSSGPATATDTPTSTPTHPTSPSTTTGGRSSSSSGTSSSKHASSESTGGAAPVAVDQIVVRPVTADGHAVSGYRVADETGAGPQLCGDPSPVAVDKNIEFCGSSALNTVACWRESGGKTVLCLRDARERRLVRLSLDGSFGRANPPDVPTPQVLELGNGASCTIRDGGAGTSPSDHPAWVEQYYCDDKTTLFGPPDSSAGITRAGQHWTVHAYPAAAPRSGSVRVVRTAYLVGTAR